ncbi:PIN domain-containing protein [Flavobacterium sp.]|uniref:PIN domain-containing protein n=1 Tax=Flavobacterium sp. TaxID=239 RepID=UPI0025F5F6B7|nr:PIN domain-containing protein [Flavobacterium sp.]
MSEFDIFIKNAIYPNADTIFSTTVEPLSKIKDECIFVMDTNALLVPYYANTEDLEAIREVLKDLIAKERFVVPGQVAREFANRRPEQIKEVFQKLNRRLDTIKTFQVSQYPLLTSIEEYKELLGIEKEYSGFAKGYREHYKEKLDSVLKKIKDWTWNDPVSSVYRELFNETVVIDLQFEKDKITKELERRYLHKIPPGYKDQSKSDEGIGDLLIWLTILDVGKIKNKSVVFVSGEEKSDWYYKSEGQTLYPRFELVTEFRLHSVNNSFHIIRFSEFLELMTSSKELTKGIEEIEQKVIFFSATGVNQSSTENKDSLIEKELIYSTNESSNFWTPQFKQISEEEFLEELTESLNRLPFVGLNSFIYKYLGNVKGYDYKSTHIAKDRLAKSKKIEVYIHYPEDDQYEPVEALRIIKN